MAKSLLRKDANILGPLTAGALYIVIAIVMTWPLASHLTTHVAPGAQEIVMVSELNLWTLAWNHRYLNGDTDKRYWDGNIFFPHKSSLAYTEPQFGTALLTFPLRLLGLELVASYNIAFLIFPTSANLSSR